MIRHIVVFLTIFKLAYSGCPFETAAKNARFIKSGNDSPDPETTTPNGCTCNSLCRATKDDGFNLDWCTVDGDCGNYDLRFGYWDHCLYEDRSKPDYVALDWKTKHDQIWAEVKADPTFGDYYPLAFFQESVVTTFENDWDVMPAGRKKAAHGVGGVCPFTVDVSEDSPFTGLLKPGSQITGLLRMGSGSNFMDTQSPGLLPAAAVKFLRSGTSSANWVLSNTLNPLPDGNHDMFSVPLQNHLPDKVDNKMAIGKFCSTGHCVTKVGLSHISTHDQDGMEYPDPVFPFKVTFIPTGEVNFQTQKPSSMEEFMDQFKKITSGMNLYTFKAHNGPDDAEGLVIGDVIIQEDCVSSFYGDTKMFFKHQWIEDDVDARPEWAEAYLNECYCNGLMVG